MRKKFLLFTLSLFPAFAVFADECAFTPAAFPGQAEDRTEYEVSATCHVGEGGIARSNVGRIDINTVQSTDMNIVWASGRGAYFVGVGSADVTYTEINREQDCSSNHVIHYTVEKGIPESGFMWNGQAVSEFTAALIPGADGVTTGEDGTISGSILTPLCVVRYKYFNEGTIHWEDKDVSVNLLTFNSSNPEVAKIDEKGQVIATSLGETTISVEWPGNENWEGVSMSYLLRIKKPVAFYFEPNNVTDSVSNVVQRLPKVVMGEPVFTHWESSNPEVATVDKNGNVTMLTPGTTQISVSCDETEEFVGYSARYTLNVVKKDPQLAFEFSQQYTHLGFPVKVLKLDNRYNVPVTYLVEDESIVTISNDGILTPKKEGSVKVGAMSEGNDTYLSGWTDYWLIITKLNVTVLNTEITAENADDVLGNGGKVKWTGSQLHIKDWKVDVSGMSDEIKEGVIKSDESLEIKVSGVCAISGAKTCINANSSVAIFGESTKDSLKLQSTGVAIQAKSLKFTNVAIRAKGVPSAIVLDGTMSMGRAYLYAEGTEYAIRCQNFHLMNSEEDKLESIKILTENVDVKGNIGFVNVIGGGASYEPAPIVEIGKKPVVVPDDEETVIEFSKEDPDGNENVFFSSSVNDTYNEESGQLEISTSLTDEQVAEALESIIPGSSAWVSALPGALTFDVPAGKGEILIECFTLPGYTLKVKIEGEEAISITQTETFGWVKVTYDLAAPAHVVIYLHAVVSSPAPAHIAAQVREEDPSAGAFIKAIKITPANAPTAIEEIIPATDGTQKIMLNGQIFIIRDGKVFNATGAQVR